ncbi:hypothetical protein FRC00_002676 [Tulasnella sp. 408]|nr:hypothetical protein FRC00_002676 [Tulasnella sp. 408]
MKRQRCLLLKSELRAYVILARWGAASRHTFPLELWYTIYHFLRLDVDDEIELWSYDGPFGARGTLRSLKQTCRSFYQLYLSTFSGAIYIEETVPDTITRWGVQPESGKTVIKTAWLNGDGMEVSKLLSGVPEPRQLIFKNYYFCELTVLHWVTVTPTVRSLKLQWCNILGKDFSAPSSFTTDQLYSIVDFRKSNVKSLDLSSSDSDAVQLPRELALLALIPSLETLTTSPRSFRTIGGLPDTLDLPPLRSLTVASYLIASINQAHLLSFLRRCPTLETLHIGHQIRSKPLEPGEPPIKMPGLQSYEGRPEYLTLFRAPALRRAAVKSSEWDGGALILSLASTSTALDGVVLELTARKNSPTTESVKRWVEEAAARHRPNWQSTERFSLVIRTAPLGEWIYSARVGRTDAGELFFEYYSGREESMAYLATSAS